jgi:hypothetical protein
MSSLKITLSEVCLFHSFNIVLIKYVCEAHKTKHIQPTPACLIMY